MAQQVTDIFLEWIRDGLKRPGKSQLGLARHLNVAHPQITRLLQGARSLKVDEIPKIAEYLELNPPGFGAPTEASRDPETQLRSALLAFGVDRADLGRAVSAVKVFVDDLDEQSSERLPDDQSAPSSRRRVATP